MNKTEPKLQEVWCFDICNIPALPDQYEPDEDEQNGLNDEKFVREIGAYVAHEDFEQLDEDPLENERLKNMSEIQMVYNMDHDFVSIQKERNEEFEELYRRGLKSYIDGDWFGASTAW